MSHTHPKQLRSDAQRNRARILAAAGEVFADVGADASMEVVAAGAGVGVGSIYRAFGTKSDLLREVYLARLDDLIVATEAAVAIDDAERAFRAYLTAVAQFYAANRLFTQIKHRLGLDIEWARSVHARRMRAVSTLLRRAQQAGVVHEHLTVPDLEFTLRAVCSMAQETGEHRAAVAQRIILMTLLRASEPSAPMPRGLTQRDYDDWVLGAFQRHSD